MYERIKYLYLSEKITLNQLDIAVSKGWITAEQKQMILDIAAEQ